MAQSKARLARPRSARTDVLKGKPQRGLEPTNLPITSRLRYQLRHWGPPDPPRRAASTYPIKNQASSDLRRPPACFHKPFYRSFPRRVNYGWPPVPRNSADAPAIRSLVRRKEPRLRLALHRAVYLLKRQTPFQSYAATGLIFRRHRDGAAVQALQLDLNGTQ